MSQTNSELVNQSLTGLFFLYFVLMSGELTSLLNCGIQRMLKKSILLKHILVFFSIFVFTFILKWYTLSSLQTEGFAFTGEKYEYLESSFGYTIIIYAMFLLTSKMETSYLFVFLILLLLSFLMFLFYKIHANIVKSSLLDQLFFVTNENMKEILDDTESVSDANTAIMLKNSMAVLYLFMTLIVIIGFMMYLMRQKEEHAHHWSFIKFLFGTNTCNFD